MNLRNRFPAGSPQKDYDEQRGFGFTLIELMIVMAIIAILIGIAAVRYDKVVQHSKEAVLKQNLRAMLIAIDIYILDKLAAPQPPSDRTKADNLPAVPRHPINP